jgi:glycosyltransferase involved in cell wall biosynthesis
MSRCAWTLFSFRAGLIKSLVAKRYEVIAAGSGNDGYGDQVELCGARFIDVPISARALNPWFDVKLVVAIWRLYRRERPDIVHHFTIKPVVFGSLAARWSRVPRVINTITGLGYAFTDAGFIVKWIAMSLYRFALRGSHITFFQNTEDYDLFVSLGLVDAKKAAVVPGSGVDVTKFAPIPSARKPDNQVVFLFVGRLLRHKGILEYLEAAKIVTSQNENVRFEILGALDERNPSCISEKLITDAVRSGTIHWHKKRDDVREIMSRADVVVLPSYREGTPRVLLEAGAMEKPVITTDAIGCRDVVVHGETGLIVPLHDSRALAEACQALADSKDNRERMGRLGRERIVQNYDERLVFESTFRAYVQT